ncbi:alpha-amylase family glycosyl hydrolase [Mucilaginibacter sp.]
MKKIISCIAISTMLFGIIPATAMAQTTQDQDPPQYGKPFTMVPDRRDVSMYQVNMRSFSKEGNFKGVIARLDSIKALGINVVYILPIYPVGVLNAQGSPYAVKDYRQINTEFGTLDDLRALVNGVHKRKMAIIIDWVGNHTSWDNPWIVNKDWYEQDSTGNIKHAQTWRDVAQLNFKNNAMRLTMIKDMKYWVLTANVDGFRCDYADGPPADFWKQAIDTLRNIPAHKLLFLAEGTRGENFNAGFDYNFGFRFFDNLKKIYKDGKSVKSIDTINIKDYTNASDGQQMVRYITNHDVNSSDGSPIQLFGGKKGSMAAFVVVAYMKSVPMIYDGQEVGTPYRLIFPFTKSKVDWTLNPDVTAEYKKVIAFRNGSETVRRGELTSYSSDDVCAFTKKLGNKAVFVLSNLRNTTVSYTIPSNLSAYNWTDGFTGNKSKLSSVITLAPYQYIVLKN